MYICIYVFIHIYIYSTLGGQCVSLLHLGRYCNHPCSIFLAFPFIPLHPSFCPYPSLPILLPLPFLV